MIGFKQIEFFDHTGSALDRYRPAGLRVYRATIAPRSIPIPHENLISPADCGGKLTKTVSPSGSTFRMFSEGNITSAPQPDGDSRVNARVTG
jgi:hypothetical protein